MSGIRVRRWWLPGLLALALLAVGVLAWLQRGGSGTGQRIAQGAVVRVGYAVESPYAFVASDGRITGASAETARLVAARLGWRVEWVQTSFDALIPELLDGRFDLIAAGMFVTPRRARVVRFADPELQVAAGLLVRSGNPKQLHAAAELQARRDVRAAVLAGSVEEQRLRELDVPGVLTVPDARAGAAAVESGLADTLVLSLPTVRTMARAHADLQALDAADPGATAYVASAFRPDDARLLQSWNRAQAQVLTSPDRLRAIAAFGFMPGDVPSHPAATSRAGS